MSRKRIHGAVMVLLAGALVFTACDNFFSSSWGTARTYEASKIELSTDNLDGWLDTAVGNRELANALTEKIKKELKEGNLSEPDKAAFRKAGVELAVEAAGLGESLIGNAADLLGGLSNGGGLDSINDILGGIQEDFQANDGNKAANDIAEIIDGSLKTNGSVPEFKDDDLYARNADPSDVSQAVMVLALAVIGDQDPDTIDLSDSDSLGLSIDKTGSPPVVSVTEPDDPVTTALAAYLNLIAADTSGKFDDNELTSAIKDAFGI
jgi:hypothetical protein